MLLHAAGFLPLVFAELALRDTLARYGKKAQPAPELVYLAIDESSITLDEALPAEIQSSPALVKMQTGWPWPRDVYPLIIDRLVSCGARVVAIDLLFPTSRDGDAAFREALDRYRDKVVVGSNFSDADRAQGGTGTYVAPAPTLLPQGDHADDRAGYVNFRPDLDDVVRRASYRTTASREFGMEAGSGEEELFSFAARILQKAGHGGDLPGSPSPKPFRFAGPGAFPELPIYQIFVKKFWDGPLFRGGEFFRGKFVVIGPAGNWNKDYLQTPLGSRPGPELHLDAVNAVLTGDFLSEPSRRADLLLILLGGAVAWLLSAFVAQPFLRFLAMTGAGLAFYGAALLLFNARGLEISMLGFLLVLVSSTLVRLAWEQVFDRLERRRTRRTLERYVSRDIAGELLDNPESYLNSLGGVRKPVTILFSDLRGFTTRTEGASDPHALVAQLNEYFNAMVRTVFAHDGTLDKFIGDSVMAYWGGIRSVDLQTDARQAVKTALEMRRALAVLNADWQKRGIEPIEFGIGINHGEAIVGNLGSEAKMEVSVVGDAVNTASRLEGATKTYRVDFIIGEPVEPLVRDVFVLRKVDRILLQGKTRPVDIYTVLSERAAGGAPDWLAIHEEALRLYGAGDFEAAEIKWREVLAAVPGDALASLFIDRCRDLRASPPAAWNGVFEMRSK